MPVGVRAETSAAAHSRRPQAEVAALTGRSPRGTRSPSAAEEVVQTALAAQQPQRPRLLAEHPVRPPLVPWTLLPVTAGASEVLPARRPVLLQVPPLEEPRRQSDRCFRQALQ